MDKVWLTCCALHNWLLDIDGLDKDWDGRNVLPVSGKASLDSWILTDCLPMWYNLPLHHISSLVISIRREWDLERILMMAKRSTPEILTRGTQKRRCKTGGES